MEVYIDAGAGMSSIGEVAAWSFDLDHWGECGQGSDEASALRHLVRHTGTSDVTIVERIESDDTSQVFGADLVPATSDQIDATATILAAQRRRTIALVSRATIDQLRDSNAAVQQPAWMKWRTAEAIAWHIADTESRHYLRLLGYGQRGAEEELIAELEASQTWVQDKLWSVERDASTLHRGEAWTTVKVLRRLAWHERVELVFLRRRLRAAGMDVQ